MKILEHLQRGTNEDSYTFSFVGTSDEFLAHCKRLGDAQACATPEHFYLLAATFGLVPTIKAYRRASGEGLKEAKDAVENVLAQGVRIGALREVRTSPVGPAHYEMLSHEHEERYFLVHWLTPSAAPTRMSGSGKTREAAIADACEWMLKEHGWGPGVIRQIARIEDYTLTEGEFMAEEHRRSPC